MDWDAQRPSAPSTPTGSVSSQSTASSREKIPPYKQLSPSPTVTALSKFSDEELFRKGGDELLRILRRVESDYKGLLSEHSNMVKDVNRRFQIFVLEARGLKEINQKLQDDNQELRDLCCFLDDDRQRSRKLAREWQRFGRYTASVMHSEVTAYQEKLQQLEERQAELLADNMELKELCLFLDQERSQTTADRDDGDGSSNGTMANHEELPEHGDSDGQATPTPTPTPSEPSSVYVRQLEQRIQQLEDEKRQLTQKNGEGYYPFDQDAVARPRLDTDLDQLGHAKSSRQGAATRDGNNSAYTVNKPEAVVHAMKVLQVHEQLERPRDPVNTEDLGDTEKAIVREMCNVVWRKLGDVGEYPPHAAPSASGLPPTSAQPPSQGQALRSSSAAANPYTPGGHTGPPPPPPPARHPSSSHVPPSPGYNDNPNFPPGFHDRNPPAASQGPLGGPGPYSVERRAQIPQPVRAPGVQQGGRDHYGGGGGGGGREQGGPGGGGGGMAKDPYGPKPSGRGGVQQAPSYSQPVVPPSAYTAERPRHMQPPPYSSSTKNMSSTASGPRGPGQNPPPPSSLPQQQHLPPQQQIPQPHHQPPSSQSQQPPPRYQRRTHPLHATQGPPPPSSQQMQTQQQQMQNQHQVPTQHQIQNQQQQQQMPRSASASATYYVSHPTSSQPKSLSASALQSQQPQGAPSSIPGGTYLYTQRSGPPVGGQYSQFKPPHGSDQPPRSADNVGRVEWKQTYLDD